MGAVEQAIGAAIGQGLAARWSSIVGQKIQQKKAEARKRQSYS